MRSRRFPNDFVTGKFGDELLRWSPNSSCAWRNIMQVVHYQVEAELLLIRWSLTNQVFHRGE